MNTALTSPTPSVGELLRNWRQRRRLSQLDLACNAGISTRHLSFVETGRARPSREMLLHLAEQLELPLRERNILLTTGGFAPVYRQRPLADLSLAAARRAIDLVLSGHEPYPALVVDRHWQMVAANRAVAPLLEGVTEELLQPPVNVLRLSLHPDGLAPRILNYAQWRAHLLARLHSQAETAADAVLSALFDELRAYRAPAGADATVPADEYGGVVVPLRLRTPAGVLSFLSTTTVFGTPLDITLAELAIESFFPADGDTAEAIRAAVS